MNAPAGPLRKLLPSRLHAKVSLGVVIPLLLILGIFTAVGYRQQREATLRQLSELAAYTGRVVESDLRHQMVNADFEGLQVLLDTIGSEDEIRRLYLLNTDGEVIFAPQGRDTGLRLSNRRADCQPCHALPVAQRPDSVVVTTPEGERVFRSMAPIENSPECARCHDDGQPLIGLLLIDVSVAPFSERLGAYLRQNLWLWLSVSAITITVVYFVVNRFVLRRLAAVAEATGRLAQGKQPPPLPEGPPDEIGHLVGSFNTMAERIETRKRQNEALSRELQQQSSQRGLLLKRLITAQEDERIRVARELHDELGQSLTGLALRAQALERHVEEAGQGRAILEQMRALVQGTTEQMYEIIMALRPSVLDDLGLVSALRAYTERTLSGSGVDYIIDDSCFQARLPAEMETALFRAFQEGINNVVRHARATRLHIELSCDGSQFHGTLEDNGKGFQATVAQQNGQEEGGFGLLGMRERITQCGGTMTIASSPGAGTRIEFWIPLGEVFDASSD